jgi:hypothetical protein
MLSYMKSAWNLREKVALCVLAGLLAACGSNGAATSTATSPFLVEPVFQQFYDFLGGQSRLGVALSPAIVEGSTQKQYLENALMLYDPALPPSEQYSLAPVGQQMGAWDEPLPDPGTPGVYFVEGYIVYEGFVPLYEQLGGQRYVGKPLTGVRFLAEQNRVEQYFENLGLYLDLDDTNAQVQLMAYGRLACADTCGISTNPAAIIQVDLPYGEPFVSTVTRLGDGFVGARLVGPYQTADGSLEVIYENVVLAANPDQSERAAPRPVLALLGIAPDALVTRLDNANMMFYGIDGEYGFNVPLFFSDYITQHGGFEIVGQPISELKLLGDGSASQCYANACLRYVNEDGGRVEAMPMGVEYKARFYDQPAPEVQAPTAELRIQVWEEHSQISSAEQQIIYASLYAGTQLLANLQPYLEISLPGGGVSIYQFPPSDAGGQTQLAVPPVQGQNGTLVPYQVCVQGFGAGETCVSESYMIWGNP